MVEPRHLSDDEKNALAQQYLTAMRQASKGVPTHDVALAVLRAAGAMLRSCAKSGQEATLLEIGVDYFRAEMELVRAGRLPRAQIH